MFQIVLVQPEIPPNTGNIIRLAANTGCSLHLVEPLGFSMQDKQMRRAGLDYHEYAELIVHEDWGALLQAIAGRRRFAFTTKASRNYAEMAFQAGDVLVFGPETRGLSSDQLAEFAADARLRLPMLPGQRSLNLSNAVAVTVFEAWRQQGYAGADLR
jgi:tRNA (cytidine/uridine-2'-O-)-methyltransferase